ncbi:unnamed protein product [Oppiella nova]|uniref:Uncharacterized protein n=1 Tax=Oppiella nova TaxID=334625 RepID=A0A7R9M9M5_9ACAR|nr:unnamed protein product [Oppiella nova]CAG2173186.1 unnamed protein product [Oppiella nova]
MKSDHLPIDESISLANEVFEDVMKSNDVVKGLATIEPYCDRMEVHAELIHSYSLILDCVILAIETHNIYALIKLAYRLQRFVKKLNCSKIIMRSRSQWESEASRLNFESSVRLANGVSHLVISNAPPKILRVINFLGIRGVESTGWNNINKTAFELPGIASQLARVFRLLNDPHVTPKRFIYMELTWSYALQSNWDSCIEYAEKFRTGSLYTPAIATYMEAIFRYAKSTENDDQDEKQKATELFHLVPTLRIRHLGKTITPEKVAVVRAQEYVKNDELLILPDLFSLPAQAYCELGLIEFEMKNNDKAIELLNKCIDDYTGYLNENYIHFKAYAALRELGLCTAKQGTDHNKLEEYRKQWLKNINIDEKCYEKVLETEEEVGN